MISDPFVNPRKLLRINRKRLLLGLRVHLDLDIAAGPWQHGDGRCPGRLIAIRRNPEEASWKNRRSGGELRVVRIARVIRGRLREMLAAGPEWKVFLDLLVCRRGRLQVINRKGEELFEFQLRATNAIIKGVVRIGDMVLLDHLPCFEQAEGSSRSAVVHSSFLRGSCSRTAAPAQIGRRRGRKPTCRDGLSRMGSGE
jgi:hypothetical protein